MKINFIILLFIFTSLIYSEDLKTYNNDKIKFSFKYPKSIVLSEKHLSNSSDFYILILLYDLPLKKDSGMGFDNDNIIKIKNGLNKGIIDGFPFHYKELSNVIKINDKKNGLENFILSQYDTTDIEFDHEIIIFHNNFMIRIKIIADAYKKVIIKKYLNIYFEEANWYHDSNGLNGIIWKDNKSVSELLKLIKLRNDEIFKKWLEISDVIIESLNFY